MALTVLGLSQIMGSLLGSPLLLGVGALSGAAPLPRVFSRQQGIETYARRATLEILTVEGRLHTVAVDRGFGRRVRGPTVRMAAYAHSALYAGLGRTGASRQALLAHAFCRPGDVARELGLPAPVRSVRVGNWSVLANDEPVGGTELRCADASP